MRNKECRIVKKLKNLESLRFFNVHRKLHTRDLRFSYHQHTTTTADIAPAFVVLAAQCLSHKANYAVEILKHDYQSCLQEVGGITSPSSVHNLGKPLKKRHLVNVNILIVAYGT